MNEFDSKGITTLYNYGNNISSKLNKIESLIKLGNDYNIFTTKDSSTNSSVKFILKTE